MSSRPQTYDHLRSKKKPNYKKVPILLDQELGELVDQAKEKLDAAKEVWADEPESSPRKGALQEQMRLADEELAEAIEEADSAVAVFKIRSISGPAYDELVAQNPITPDQEKKIRERGGEPPSWNADTFPPSLVFACLVEPKLTEDQFMEIWKSPDWNANELMSLFWAALEVNSNRRQVDWGKG